MPTLMHAQREIELERHSQIERNGRGEGPRRLFTVQEAAQYLAVSASTLYGWVWQHRIPFIKLGRALRFDPADLNAFVEANKQLPRQDPDPDSSLPRCYNTRAAGKG